MIHKLDLASAVQALDSAPMGIIILDDARKIIWANETLQHLLNVEEDLSGKSEEDIPPSLHTYLFEPQDVIHITALPDGKERWLQCWDQPLDLGGQTPGRIRYCFDITEKKQLQLERNRLADELERISTRDPITGLPNRRALMHSLEPLISRSRRYNNPLTVMRLRLTYPVAADTPQSAALRDQALVAIAHLLKDQMRWADIIGRFDDDEFLLVLPETSEEAALQLVAKLCGRIADLDVATAEKTRLRLVIQCGVAGWSQGDDAQRLLRRAGQAMNTADFCETRH